MVLRSLARTLVFFLGAAVFVPAGALALEPGEFDPARFDSLLKVYVKENGVDYAAWKANGIPALDAFLAEAGTYDPSVTLGKEPKTAFWLNAYNAWSVRQVLGRWPVKSVSEIPGFFDANRVRLAGKDMTLAEVETTLAHLLPNRPQFAMALASGVRGGARLQPEAFTSENVNRLITVSIRDLVDQKAIRYVKERNELHVPPAIDHYWAAYAAFPKGFPEAFASYLPLSDLVAISSRDPKRVVEPLDATLRIAGAAPAKEPAGRKP